MSDSMAGQRDRAVLTAEVQSGGRGSGIERGVRLLLTLCLAVAFQTGCSQGPVKPDSSPDPLVRPSAPVAPLTPAQQTEIARAAALVQGGKLEAAAGAVKALVKARPERGDLKARLAWIRQQQQQPEVAIDLYRAALALDPANTMAINNLALLLQGRGQFEQARAVLKEGLVHAEDAPELHYNLGVLSELYLLDLKTALAQYQRYQQLSGQDHHQVDGWIADLERRLK